MGVVGGGSAALTCARQLRHKPPHLFDAASALDNTNKVLVRPPVCPREAAREGCAQVHKRDRQQSNVELREQKRAQHGGPTEASGKADRLRTGQAAHHAHVSHLKALAECKLQNNDRNGEEEQRCAVRDEKGPAAKVVGHLGKAPDVSETDG
jgi:hypothetical protein